MTIPTATRWRLYFPLGGGALVTSTQHSEEEVAANPVGFANTNIPRDTEVFRFIEFGEVSMAEYAGGPNLCQTIGGTSSAYREGDFFGGYTSNHDVCFDDFVPTSQTLPSPPGPMDYWSPNNGASVAYRFNWLEFSFSEPVSIAEYGIANTIYINEEVYLNPNLLDVGLSWQFQYYDNTIDDWVTVDDRSFEKLPNTFNYFIVPGTVGPMNVAQSVVEVLRSNGSVYGARVNQMVVEVLRFNGVEGVIGGVGGDVSVRDPIPGENPAVTNWFSMF